MSCHVHVHVHVHRIRVYTDRHNFSTHVSIYIYTHTHIYIGVVSIQQRGAVPLLPPVPSPSSPISPPLPPFSILSLCFWVPKCLNQLHFLTLKSGGTIWTLESIVEEVENNQCWKCKGTRCWKCLGGRMLLVTDALLMEKKLADNNPKKGRELKRKYEE